MTTIAEGTVKEQYNFEISVDLSEREKENPRTVYSSTWYNLRWTVAKVRNVKQKFARTLEEQPCPSGTMQQA